jgi:hypothetical protein
MEFSDCRWTPLRDKPEQPGTAKLLHDLMVAQRPRFGPCLDLMKQNRELVSQRDVPPTPTPAMLEVLKACQVVARDLSAVATARSGCSPFQVTDKVAPDLRDLSTLLSSVGIIAKVRLIQGETEEALELLLDLVRFTQIASSGRVDLQLANALVMVWSNQGHDLLRHTLQAVFLEPPLLNRLISELGVLITTEPPVANSYLTDAIAMQMQVTLPQFFGPKWMPPVGWNKIMHPGGAREKSKPLLAPVGSPVESMFLYLYTRLKARDLTAQCPRTRSSATCLNALLSGFQEEVHIMEEPSRQARFAFGKKHWGLARTLAFMAAVEEKFMRVPDFSITLVEYHRRVASLYHARLHARVLQVLAEGQPINNPDQFRTAAWKPYVFEEPFGQDTSISLVDGTMTLNSSHEQAEGSTVSAPSFRYEFNIKSRPTGPTKPPTPPEPSRR